MNLTLNKDFFIRNRKKLFLLLPNNSISILFPAEEFSRNADTLYKYRQNSDLFYFSGLKQEKTIILLHKTENQEQEYAFIIEPNEKMLIWTGHKYSIDEAKDISGIKNIFYLTEFEKVFQEIYNPDSLVYYSMSSNVRGLIYENKIVAAWKESLKNEEIQYRDLDTFSMQLRLQKEKEEIDLMQIAIDITGEAFEQILKFLSPGIYEYEVEAEISRWFIKNGVEAHAYSPIIASGKNNCVLHYETNRNLCKNGDLLLMDFGAEYNYYAADLTRTIPISGKFSNRQKQVYSSVLKVLKEMKTKFVPGNTIRELNKECELLIQEELLKLDLLTEADIKNQEDDKPAFKKYFMHGLSHFIGLDVHDVGKKDTVLLPGMVLSCEPGIYIAEEGFGIRLENDILVAENPIDLCSNIPIEISDICK
ncbi:MAG: M24 family metallopeptidase [Bacteroidales bacterium]|jgi:Xaa-Pro aminopeptidase|nr:aminopeptidase P N-terminal domain-containing protein [Bacteroidales bacterium]MCK9499141.1 aminopeptidase P N-terminal domain-containing protein [Bacteroidales bacterium]MDY0314498.1 aminopeptidase P N-terminal domain-containing protein [Bacteroidales bacterium]NLB86790.1 M24 family metallopeptidase [Bacteroidales bacterium]